MNKYIKLEQEIERAYNLFIDSCDKLNNVQFINNAPKNIIDKVIQQKQDSLIKFQYCTTEIVRFTTDLLNRVNSYE